MNQKQDSPTKKRERKPTASRVPSLSEEESVFIRQVSYRMGIDEKSFSVSMEAARRHPEIFAVLETLVEISREQSKPDVARMAAISISNALNNLASSDEDPLAELDNASKEEVMQGYIETEIESQKLREQLLACCITVDEAAQLAERSRQRLEVMRREGKLLAIRIKNRWVYPRWQFDPNFPGGVISGIDKVIKKLQLSTTGVAVWLTQPFESLGNKKPIELLIAGQEEKVIELAEEGSYTT